jgi:DNA-binding Lrp family transcriptional regulator
MPDLDSLDRQIFQQLAQNGRMANQEVARRIGVSEKTVRQRVRRLSEAGMRIIATIDGEIDPSRTILLVHSEAGQRFSLAARLAALPEVDKIHLTNGAYELVVEASFASDAEALDFYVRHIETAPGVRASESTHIIETIAPQAEHPSDLFDGFDAKAERLDSLPELIDLACDIAASRLGTDRIFVSCLEMDSFDPAKPPYGSNIRWRGLSSRYIDAVCSARLSDSVIATYVLDRGQHIFISDAQTDPLFHSLADLAVSEGFHSYLAVPVRSDNANLGTMILYYGRIIPYSTQRVAQAQELADLLGKHVARRFNNDALAKATTNACTKPILEESTEIVAPL